MPDEAAVPVAGGAVAAVAAAGGNVAVVAVAAAVGNGSVAAMAAADGNVAVAPDSSGAPRTYVIHHYPAHLIEHWTQEDGRGVTLRPVLPQDDLLAQAFFRALSPESRHSRFFISLSEIPARMLAQLTNVDYVRHMALIAQTVVYGREFQIGEARYVVADDGTSAEFAIAVADDWQGAGIGSRLLRALENAARAAGLARLTGDVLGENRKALDFMRQRGFTVQSNREDARLAQVNKVLGPA